MAQVLAAGAGGSRAQGTQGGASATTSQAPPSGAARRHPSIRAIRRCAHLAKPSRRRCSTGAGRSVFDSLTVRLHPSRLRRRAAAIAAAGRTSAGCPAQWIEAVRDLRETPEGANLVNRLGVEAIRIEDDELVSMSQVLAAAGGVGGPADRRVKSNCSGCRRWTTATSTTRCSVIWWP